MKRLILMGPIGCGKSTMIRNALGQALSWAGGFLTIRQMDGPTLLGFDLVSPRAPRQGHRFLDFERGVVRNDQVFSDFGVGYLQTSAPFAVADEFGGLELLNDGFFAALLAFLQADIPCIGVLKTEDAAAVMAEKVTLGNEYLRRYRQLRALLEADPQTLLLATAGWQDFAAAEQIAHWTAQHVRR